MEIQAILNALQGVVAFFLIQFYLKNGKLEEKLNKHETEIQVLEANQSQLQSKVDTLMKMMEDIGKDIKDISVALAKKKNIE